MNIDQLTEKNIQIHQKEASLPSVLKGAFLSKMAGVMLLTGCHVSTLTVVSPGISQERSPIANNTVSDKGEITPESIPFLERDKGLQKQVDRWYSELLARMEGPYVAFMSKKPAERTVKESEELLKILREELMKIVKAYAQERPEAGRLLSLPSIPAGDIIHYLFEQYGYLFSSEAKAIEVEGRYRHVIHIDMAEIDVDTKLYCNNKTCRLDSAPAELKESVERNVPRILEYSLDPSIVVPEEISIRVTRPGSGIKAVSTVTRAGFVTGNPPSLYILYHKFEEGLLANSSILHERVEDLMAHELSHAVHRNHFASMKDGVSIPYESTTLPSIVPIHVDEAMAFLHSAMAGKSPGENMFQHLLWGHSTEEYALGVIVLEDFVRDFLDIRKSSGVEIPAAFDGFIEKKKTFARAFLDRMAEFPDRTTAQSMVTQEMKSITADPDADRDRTTVFEKHLAHLQRLFADLKK